MVLVDRLKNPTDIQQEVSEPANPAGSFLSPGDSGETVGPAFPAELGTCVFIGRILPLTVVYDPLESIQRVGQAARQFGADELDLAVSPDGSTNMFVDEAAYDRYIAAEALRLQAELRSNYTQPDDAAL